VAAAVRQVRQGKKIVDAAYTRGCKHQAARRVTQAGRQGIIYGVVEVCGPLPLPAAFRRRAVREKGPGLGENERGPVKWMLLLEIGQHSALSRQHLHGARYHSGPSAPGLTAVVRLWQPPATERGATALVEEQGRLQV
jgi:hypothetical protein